MFMTQPMHSTTLTRQWSLTQCGFFASFTTTKWRKFCFAFSTAQEVTAILINQQAFNRICN